MDGYMTPNVNDDYFTCPQCGSNAPQSWSDLQLVAPEPHDPHFEAEHYRVSKCSRCDDYAFWRDSVLLFPSPRLAPYMEDALPEHARQDYHHARIAYAVAPAACALLRSTLQHVFDVLGAGGNALSDSMSALATRYRISAETDVLFTASCMRASASLPPGVIHPTDTLHTAHQLFALIAAILRDTGLAPTYSSGTVAGARQTPSSLP